MNSRPSASDKAIQTDIAIIGAGGAGLTAAVAAAEEGVKVVVLEKRNMPGGNSAVAESFFAAESPVQQWALEDAPKDVLFKMAMDYAHWKINPRIIRAFIDKSGDTVRWLQDKGLEIFWLSPYYPNQVIRTEHQAKRGGADVVKVLLRCCEDMGVPLLRHTPAKKILTNAEGEVTGVLATRGAGELTIAAKSVVIATGGYAGNKELLKKYSPWYTDDILSPQDYHTGDGLLMALETGANTEGLGQLRMSGPRFHGPRKHAKTGGIFCQQPNTIWVNKRGERFVDETAGFKHFESVNALLQQLGKVCYTLFDEQIKRTIIERGPIKVRQGVFYGPQKADLASAEKELQKETERGTVTISGSWDEIAKWIGAEPGILKETIDEYNAFCDRGHDDIFAKDRRYLIPLRNPPYYAMKGRAEILTTMGGIKINHRMEVLNCYDSPIPGLYVVGDDTGGWEPDTYNVNLSGSGLGFALNSGRIAGENAARYVTDR
jgi:fumarate reductase flavoprotein subunit